MTLIPFSYENQPIRVLTIDNEPWFMVVDVAEVLGLVNVHSSLAFLDEDEKGIHTMDTPGGAQKFRIVSEAGLYSLILRSRKPEAKRFKRWITHEVLPSIRKRGMYATPDAVESMLEDPDLLIRLLNDLKAERAKRAELAAKAEQDAPKVIFADAVSAAKTTILIGDLAKLLKGNGIDVGSVRLFRWLRDKGFLIARSGADYNSPTQKAMELGLFEVKETAVSHADGHVTISKTPKVTGKGQRYFIERFLDGRFQIV